MIVYLVFRWPPNRDQDIAMLGVFSSETKADNYMRSQPEFDQPDLDKQAFVLDKEVQ